MNFRVIESSVSSVSYGTWTETVLAAGQDIDGTDDYFTHPAKNTPNHIVPTDGEFEFNFSASSLADQKNTNYSTGTDTDNFMKLINTSTGTAASYKIHVNESGSSMDGAYYLDIVGKGSYQSFKQQVVYTTKGNDVTSVITTRDSDTTTGVNGKDISVEWDYMNESTIASQEIYIMPGFLSSVDTLPTAATTPITIIHDKTTRQFIGDINITKDSENNPLATGTYTVFVVAKDSTGTVVNLDSNYTLTHLKAKLEITGD